MIDEKKLIEDIHCYFKNKIDNDESEVIDNDILTLNKEICGIIKTQPKLNEWIPCSERLPEDGEDVLVWFEYFRYGSYNRLFQTFGLSYTYNGKWSGFVNNQSGWHQLSIMAWQPLPEPYREKVE